MEYLNIKFLASSLIKSTVESVTFFKTEKRLKVNDRVGGLVNLHYTDPVK